MTENRCLLPLPGGRSRRPRTGVELEYARSLCGHEDMRTCLSAAVDEEVATRRELVGLVAELGPVHPRVNEALQAWRTARGAKRRIAGRLESTSDRLDAAICQWAKDEATNWASSSEGSTEEHAK